MKYIKLKITSFDKNKQVLDILNKYQIKFINNFYEIENKLFNQFKDEIKDSDLDLSINRNPDYVIIKEKMSRTPPQKYVTQKQFNDFKNDVDDKFYQVHSEISQVRTEMKNGFAHLEKIISNSKK